jgi:hypothetical protein
MQYIYFTRHKDKDNTEISVYTSPLGDSKNKDFNLANFNVNRSKVDYLGKENSV